MARPSSKPRLPELVPDEVALAFTCEIFDHYEAGIREHLAPVCTLSVPTRRQPQDYLRETSLFMTVQRLALYAIRGELLDGSVLELLAPLELLAASPLWGRVDVASIAANVDPDTERNPMKLVIAAALAREQLAVAKATLTSSQLAILAGMTRRNVGQLIRDGELVVEREGRQGTHGGALIKASVARRWLAQRGVAGL